MRDVEKGSLNVRNMILIAVMSAIAYMLTLIPVPLVGDFLKPEISDVPAIIAAVAVAPYAGMVVKLIQNVIDVMTKPVGLGIGQLANFLVGSTLAVTVAIFFKAFKMKNVMARFVPSAVIATIAMCVVGGWGNFFIFMPIYSSLYGNPDWLAPDKYPALVFGLITPFNLVKGIVECCVAFPLIRALRPILNRTAK